MSGRRETVGEREEGVEWKERRKETEREGERKGVSGRKEGKK